MKYQNIIVYLIIPLALLSIPSLLANVHAQTNSSSSANQTASQQQQQQNQNANLTAQALMKTDIVALKNTLMNAKSKYKSHCTGFNATISVFIKACAVRFVF